MVKNRIFGRTTGKNNFEILVKKLKILGKNKTLAKNPNFDQRIEMLVTESKFWSKIIILLKESKFWSKNQNFGQKSKFWSKNLSFGRKSKCWQNNGNFDQTIEISAKNVFHFLSFFSIKLAKKRWLRFGRTLRFPGVVILKNCVKDTNGLLGRFV